MGLSNGIWIWTCHQCGWSLTNTNTIRHCQECGAQIRCEEAEGHSDFDGDHMCDNGCGFDFRTHLTNTELRRKDY